jgi:hypothetical protein
MSVVLISLISSSKDADLGTGMSSLSWFDLCLWGLPLALIIWLGIISALKVFSVFFIRRRKKGHPYC